MSIENPSERRPEEEKKIEMDTPLESRELFELLANAGSKGFRPEFAGELEQSGTEKEDVELAIKFMGCLAVVNKLVFGDKIELIFSTSKEKQENLVQYTPKKEGQYEENYWINIKAFGETIRKIISENREVFLDENDCLTEKGEAPAASFEELLLGIALHEVRHRLQFKRNQRTIGRGDRVVIGESHIDDKFIDLQASFMDSQRRKLKEQGVEGGLLDRKADKKELDAIIIEKIAVSRLHHRKTSLEQLKQLATIESEVSDQS